MSLLLPGTTRSATAVLLSCTHVPILTTATYLCTTPAICRPIPPLPHRTPLQLFRPEHRSTPNPSIALAPSVTSSNTDNSSIPDTSGIDTTPLPALGDDNISPDDCWAMQQLQLDGEDIVGLCQQLQYLLLAEILLVEPLTRLQPQPSQPEDLTTPTTTSSDNATTPSAASAAATSMLADTESAAAHTIVQCMPSLPWWALRITVLHQSVLAGRSATLLRRTNMLTRMLHRMLPPTEPHVSSSEASTWLSPALAVVLTLELGLAQMSYGYVDAARRYLHDSEAQLGFTVSLTGVCVGGWVTLGMVLLCCHLPYRFRRLSTFRPQLI